MMSLALHTWQKRESKAAAAALVVCPAICANFAGFAAEKPFGGSTKIQGRRLEALNLNVQDQLPCDTGEPGP
jgi:hypothetical protein